jgi:protein-tyrosine phosphatase
VHNYLGYLSQRDENVFQAVRRLAAPDAGPALVHCAAGKDRTGVLVALVLDAVGVQRSAVLADYMLSAEQVPAMFRRWTTAAGEPMPADLTPHLPRVEVMATVLARLDAEHGIGEVGGAAGWLRANGLDVADLDRLRGRLTG